MNKKYIFSKEIGNDQFWWMLYYFLSDAEVDKKEREKKEWKEGRKKE